ncbi:hypothetical protein [Collimonas arenae]|uniref:hypothetical protein n=1 Tax=Collimonas arenae TaxID=279058 RepID=UPI00056E0E23|nr:hypothetical protein [Collimonas arenae]
MQILPKITRTEKGVTSQPLGIRLAPAEVTEVEQFASRHSQSRARFLRSLILRGLADYKREFASNQ